MLIGKQQSTFTVRLHLPGNTGMLGSVRMSSMQAAKSNGKVTWGMRGGESSQ